MIRSLRSLALLCGLVLLGFADNALAEAEPSVRIAITCQENGRPAPEMQDRITALLSGEGQFEVLERARLNLLLKEGETLASPEQRIRLGKFLSLDYFLNFRQGGEATQGAKAWSIEIVNAQSGKLAQGCTVAVKPRDDAAEVLARQVSKMAHEKLAPQSLPQKNAESTRVAVLDFVPRQEGDPRELGLAMRLGADVRTFLTGGGMTVLDRALSQQVARENGLQQEGLVEARTGWLPLLGADVVVTGRLEPGSGELEMTALEVKAGRVMATQRFPYDPAQEAGSLPVAARTWLVDVLRPARTPERTFEETLQIEALAPFYQGVAKYMAGQYLEAAGEFQKAYTSNDKFGDAMLWEARCYDAVGLGPLADAERRFVKIGLLGRGVSSSGKACPDDAVTFLGITGADLPAEQDAAKTVEALAVDRLAKTEPRLRLASHLVPLRDEYDVLVGSTNTEGTRWTEVPSFFSTRSVRGELAAPDANGMRQVQFLLVDTLNGKTLAKSRVALGKDAGQWRGEIEQGIAGLRISKTMNETGESVAPAPLPPVPDLEKQVSSRNGIGANLPLLQLALADPGNALIAGRNLAKGAAGRSEWDAFMNFAFRDYLISKMPESNPNRAWLELQRLGTFLPFDQTGAYLSGEKIDAPVALAAFVEKHPADLPGCVAEYMLLYDQLSAMPPEQLAERLTRLETRLSQYQSADLNGLDMLQKMTQALRITAQVATGAESGVKLPTDTWPQRLKLEFERDGKPCVRKHWGWMTMCWKNIAAAAANPVEEARASLAVLGRGDELRHVNEQWLRDYPTSCGMMFYVISGLHEVNHLYGRPFSHEFDADAERQLWRDMTEYAQRNLIRQLGLAASAHDVDYLEDWARQLVEALAEPAFAQTIPDDQWEALRRDLVQAMEAANVRMNRSGNYTAHHFHADWRIMSRRAPADDDPGREEVLNKERPDRLRFMEEEQRAADASWRTSPAIDRTWTNLVHTWRFNDHFNAKERARIYLRHEARLKELFPGPDFSAAELFFLYDFGMTVMEGGETAVAEAVFSRIVESESNDLNSFGNAMEIRANAALNLGWIARASGRKAEALEQARRVMEITIQCGRPLHVLGRINGREARADLSEREDKVNSNLRAFALRLISELRNENPNAPLSRHLRSVVVHTPNIKNADVTFYYRIPERFPKGHPAPVLVICPSQSSGALDFCMDDTPWAKFADAHGIVLVAPQFVPEHRGNDLPQISGFQPAHIWSGQATLDALEKIRAKYPIDVHHLLMHGYGGGAQFVQFFSRWAPERCAALSIHSAQNWLWKDGEPLKHPLSSLAKVPCLATTGEEDSYGCDEWNRMAVAVQWVTMARSSGVPVIWKAWPGVAHQNTPEMQKMCEAFFAACLRSPAPKNPAFIGDLRTGIYYKTHDPQVKNIPSNFQQNLPTAELAAMWGTQK